MDDRKHVDARRVGGPEHLDNMSLGVALAILPAVELSDHFLTNFRPLGSGDIESAGKARVIGDDMVEIRSLLQRANDGSAYPLNDADDAPLLAPVAAWAAMEARFLNKAGHDAVAVQSGAEIIRGDEEILAPFLVCQYMAGSAGMDLQLTCEEIGFLWQDVVILADTDDTPLPLQNGQCVVEKGEIVTIHPKGAGNCRSLKRLSLPF
jgi:hypothetical protein